MKKYFFYLYQTKAKKEQPVELFWMILSTLISVDSMKRLFLITALSVCLMTGNAQDKTSFWYFGEFAGINFTSSGPRVLTDGALITGEGCSSMSTDNGLLQFYTDGRFVYDRNHDQMPAGSGLLGHSSSTQSAIIVPKPWSTTQYYIKNQPN